MWPLEKLQSAKMYSQSTFKHKLINPSFKMAIFALFVELDKIFFFDLRSVCDAVWAGYASKDFKLVEVLWSQAHLSGSPFWHFPLERHRPCWIALSLGVLGDMMWGCFAPIELGPTEKETLYGSG